MKRVVGFALFWVAVGIMIAMLFNHSIVRLLCMILCLLAAYELFYCK